MIFTCFCRLSHVPQHSHKYHLKTCPRRFLWWRMWSASARSFTLEMKTQRHIWGLSRGLNVRQNHIKTQLNQSIGWYSKKDLYGKHCMRTWFFRIVFIQSPGFKSKFASTSLSAAFLNLSWKRRHIYVLCDWRALSWEKHRFSTICFCQSWRKKYSQNTMSSFDTLLSIENGLKLV